MLPQPFSTIAVTGGFHNNGPARVSILAAGPTANRPAKMANNTLQFRIATPNDAAQLQPLVQSAYRGESSRQGWTTEADLLAGERIDEKGILEKITQSDNTVIMATDSDGVLVGCCEVWRRSDDIAYFGMFAIDPYRQCGGFGRQVLAYAEDYCVKAWGVKKVEMTVIWTREELIAWYIRRGYQKTGETRPFPHHELTNGWALKDDLHFEVLEKVLEAATVVPIQPRGPAIMMPHHLPHDELLAY